MRTAVPMYSVAKRILVIGGGGFIGSHLAAHCAARGDSVHIIVRPRTPPERLEHLPGTVYRVALSDQSAMDAVMASARPEQVFHLAVADRRAPLPGLADARLSVTDDLANLVAVIAACAAAPVPPAVLVRAGSLAEYGSGPAPYDEKQREMPRDSYAAGLVAGTHYARMLEDRAPFAICTARLALTYGPAQSERFLLPVLIARLLAGERVSVARPDDRRDLMHVDDAVAGLLRLADRPVAPVVNLATGVAPSMRDVALSACAATGADPALIDFADDRGRDGIADLRGSGALACRLLGWAPQIGLDAGLARTVAWHRARQRTPEPV